ncbi:MAG: very short patch repair endonuclease [Desulfomonilaceae bacterium]|nr:very short patch repair endonuclease [Desulfomonilaceae bacterium]
MTDVFTPEERRRIMARVKGSHTRPEILVRSLVHRMGFRFRLHRRDLPGCPDLVLKKHRKVIFVHGCFWHGHEGCRRSARPTTNTEFWNRKLSGNTERDRRNQEALKKDGWKVLVVWECETKDAEKLKEMLGDFLLER